MNRAEKYIKNLGDQCLEEILSLLVEDIEALKAENRALAEDITELVNRIDKLKKRKP